MENKLKMKHQNYYLLKKYISKIIIENIMIIKAKNKHSNL